jgi:hypothetical protein
MQITFETTNLQNDKIAMNIINSISSLNKTLNNDDNDYKGFLKLKEENNTLLDKIDELKNELDDIKYEYEKLSNENETNKNTVNFQEEKLLKLKEEINELKNENEELKFLIDKKDEFIKKEINLISKDTICSLNQISNEDNTNNIEEDVNEDNTNNIEEDEYNDDKKKIIGEFEKLNNKEKEIINEISKFKEIVNQAKKGYLKYKVYPLKSHFNNYQDKYRIATSKKATKKSVALFTLNEFDIQFPESVDYIIKKEQLVFKNNMKGIEIFEKVNYITELIALAVDSVYHNVIKTDEKKLSEDDYNFKLLLLSKNLYKYFGKENIELSKENILKHIPEYFDDYIELFEHTIDIKTVDGEYKYNEQKLNKLVDTVYDKIKSKFYNELNKENTSTINDENKEFEIISSSDNNLNEKDYSAKFEEFKKSLATEDKVDLSNVKWSDIDTFEKFNNNFIKKYYRFGSIWKNTSILNKLGLAINHFENMKEFENDEFYNYVCEVFKKVQDTNIS